MKLMRLKSEDFSWALFDFTYLQYTETHFHEEVNVFSS